MAKQEHEGITVEGKPLTTYLEEEERNVIEEHRVEEIMNAAVGIGRVTTASKYENISGKRSQYSHRVKTYSPEVLAHLNYLRQAQGDKAVTDYLNTPQNGSHEGAFERAVKEADEKAKFYTNQLAIVQAQADKWIHIRQQLNMIVDQLSGKSPAKVTDSQIDLSNKELRNVWRNKIKDFLTSQNRTRADLSKFLDSNGATVTQRYGIISGYKNKGFIDISDNDDVTWIGR